MRKNNLARRLIPAVLSLVLMLNTGFTPAGTLALRGGGRQAADVDVSIGEIPFGDDSTEEFLFVIL